MGHLIFPLHCSMSLFLGVIKNTLSNSTLGESKRSISLLGLGHFVAWKDIKAQNKIMAGRFRQLINHSVQCNRSQPCSHCPRSPGVKSLEQLSGARTSWQSLLLRLKSSLSQTWFQGSFSQATFVVRPTQSGLITILWLSYFPPKVYSSLNSVNSNKTFIYFSLCTLGVSCTKF